MQAVCYRKETEVVASLFRKESEGELVPLSPGLFYPICTQDEMTMWTHWLPTSHTFVAGATYVIRGTLEKLEAPVEVMDEFKWASNLHMFDEYAIRTPVRRDAKDPLLLARAGDVWYRIALWGESKLLSLGEISSLVQESLAVKLRISKRQRRIAWTGTALACLTALVCLWWEAQPSGIGLLLLFFITFFALLPMLVYKPENGQHNFLDRYRC